MSSADELLRIVEKSFIKLYNYEEEEVSLRPAPGKWSKKEIIGHLIDSASNNHQRFVRTQQDEIKNFPSYDQNNWVKIQNYSASNWNDLIQFWRFYNLHLVHVIKRIPNEKLDTMLQVGNNEPVTLEFLVNDYLRHLKHHLMQAGA